MIDLLATIHDLLSTIDPLHLHQWLAALGSAVRLADAILGLIYNTRMRKRKREL